MAEPVKEKKPPIQPAPDQRSLIQQVADKLGAEFKIRSGAVESLAKGIAPRADLTRQEVVNNVFDNVRGLLEIRADLSFVWATEPLAPGSSIYQNVVQEGTLIKAFWMTEGDFRVMKEMAERVRGSVDNPRFIGLYDRRYRIEVDAQIARRIQLPTGK